MATNVHLTSELEQFARRCVETGRYSDVSEVVHSALRLLRDAESRRVQINAMLDEAETESESDGFLGIDEVAAELDAIIDDAESRLRARRS